MLEEHSGWLSGFHPNTHRPSSHQLTPLWTVSGLHLHDLLHAPWLCILSSPPPIQRDRHEERKDRAMQPRSQGQWEGKETVTTFFLLHFLMLQRAIIKHPHGGSPSQQDSAFPCLPCKAASREKAAQFPHYLIALWQFLPSLSRLISQMRRMN